MKLSTHVLDVARGTPAAGITVALYGLDAGARTLLSSAITNADGRTDAPLADELPAGDYELVFAVAAYFAATATAAFYTDIPIRFTLTSNGERYHVPLLLSPWGYTTYRGS
jgi:5-hydroxyisourate hydrolase